MCCKDLPNLGGLYLERTKVRGPWFGRLKSLPGLAVIYLDGSAVTDEGLSHLKGQSNLQFLSLVGIPLTGQGLTYLKSLPKLNRLEIKGCGLDFEAIDDFQVACPAVNSSDRGYDQLTGIPVAAHAFSGYDSVNVGKS